MKQKTKWKIIVLLLVLCVSMLISAFMLNYDFSKLTAYAEETTTSSVEDSLSFTLFNNGTEYKVKARNKKITEVEIPHQYNGLPVTEVSDNAFVSCTNLRSVRVPFTVKRIGTNAFYNCSNLEEINGMARVEKIGNNAFANCSKLDNVILPSTITSLGSTILRSNSKTVYSRLSEEDMTALNPNWKLSNHPGIVVYGNGLVIDGVYDENDELQGYAIKHDQNLFAEDVDFVLGDTYNGLPLLEIEREGFSGCTFKSFTLRHGEICPDAIDTEESSPIAFSEEDEECNHVVNIASNAFIGMQADEIKILVDITLIDHTNVDNVYEFENGYSSSVFCSSTARTITKRQKEMVIMIYFEEKSQDEVAEYFSITKSAVSHAMKRIYARLKNYLEKN